MSKKIASFAQNLPTVVSAGGVRGPPGPPLFIPLHIISLRLADTRILESNKSPGPEYLTTGGRRLLRLLEHVYYPCILSQLEMCTGWLQDSGPELRCWVGWREGWYRRAHSRSPGFGGTRKFLK